MLHVAVYRDCFTRDGRRAKAKAEPDADAPPVSPSLGTSSEKKRKVLVMTSQACGGHCNSFVTFMLTVPP